MKRSWLLFAMAVGSLVVGATAWGRGRFADILPEPTPTVRSASAEAQPHWSDEDWSAFSAKVTWAMEEKLDTLPLGTAMARLGQTFVGTAYVPGTLEEPGPEHIVINFRGLDCVTFVETVFATMRFVREGGPELLDRRGEAEERYEAIVESLRYRDGRLDGYGSRLHYFSEWIEDNARRGLVRDVGADLGALEDHEPVDFMSTHVDAYRQLADQANLDAVRVAEAHLTEVGRWYIPESRVAAAADQIRDGDIIAATSTVQGLDVAHTGLALWMNGRLHLLHAPLVGEAVQISEVPLADRLLRIQGQDGIMVARPMGEEGLT